jgi:hypothetical protein
MDGWMEHGKADLIPRVPLLMAALEGLAVDWVLAFFFYLCLSFSPTSRAGSWLGKFALVLLVRVCGWMLLLLVVGKEWSRGGSEWRCRWDEGANENDTPAGDIRWAMTLFPSCQSTGQPASLPLFLLGQSRALFTMSSHLISSHLTPAP